MKAILKSAIQQLLKAIFNSRERGLDLHFGLMDQIHLRMSQYSNEASRQGINVHKGEYFHGMWR